MPPWAELAWCGLFVLLSRPPAWLGLRGAVGLAALGLIPRFLTVAGTIGTVWMLSGFAWAVVIAFYLMTGLWPVLLVLLFRARPEASRLAGWMTPLAVLEGVGSLNTAAGLLMTLFTGGSARLLLGPLAGIAFASAQVFFLLRTSKDLQ